MINKTKKTPGIYSISASEYHQDTWALSSSMLKVFAADRVEFRRKYVTEYEATEASAAMNLGSFIHAAVLEPETIAEQFTIIPGQYATQKGLSSKPEAKLWAVENANATLITADDAVRGANAAASIQAVLRETFGNNWRDQFNVEQSIYWEESGIAMRARLDLVHKTRPLIIDLKSCADSSEDAFARQCSGLRYWLQAAHYERAYQSAFGEIPQFIFLAQETDGSYSPAMFELAETYKLEASRQREKLIAELQACRESNDWRNVRSMTVTTLKAKPWTFGGDYE